MGYVIGLALVLVSLYGHLLAAGLKEPLGYAALAALTAATLAYVGVQAMRVTERQGAPGQAAPQQGAPRAQLAAQAARHIAFVWIFSALVLFLVYGNVLKWREWITFGTGMAVVGALSYGLAILFDKDAARGKSDAAMLGFGRTLNIGQVAGMLIAMVGLVVDGKMAVALAASRSDWAANMTFFTGAVAIVVIGVVALLADTRAREREAALVGRPSGKS